MDEKADSSTDALNKDSVFGEYSLALQRYLHKRNRNDADTNDLLQDIVVAFMRIPREKWIQNPPAHLFGIAKNLARGFLAKADRSPITYDSGALDDLLGGQDCCCIPHVHLESRTS
jgi:DNA-directed RNA polymerase specialized sigma24 family protein